MLMAIAAIAPLRIPERNTGIRASGCAALVGGITPIVPPGIPPSNITTSFHYFFRIAYDAWVTLAVSAQGSASIVLQRISLVTNLRHW